MVPGAERASRGKNFCARRFDSIKTPSRVQTSRASSEAAKIACHHVARVSPLTGSGLSDNIAIARIARPGGQYTANERSIGLIALWLRSLGLFPSRRGANWRKSTDLWRLNSRRWGASKGYRN